MIKAIRVLTVGALLLAGGGCAYIPQQANLNPDLNIDSSGIGNNARIFINVLDERAGKSLGRRAASYGPAAEITAKQELAEVVKTKLEQGLRAQGFLPGAKDTADSILIVEIRALDYSTSTGFFTGGVHIRAALKGRAKNRDAEMEKMYRYEKEERIIIVPTAGTNEKWINEALSTTLNKLLTDSELLAFLAAP